MRIAILISGRGSNMVSLIESAQKGVIPDSQVVVVISDKADAPGLAKARELGIETLTIERGGRKRAEHDAEIIANLRPLSVDLICLAGYMRLLSPRFVEEFRGKIINIHPSLLPSFKGLDAQRQAIDYGVKVSGCTVHFVDENLDNGAIIAQKVVEVSDFDTPESLSAKILIEEHKLYVETVKKIVCGEITVKNRKVL
ncbi:MAG: phosphoribosylglycinamide formyltransferase [Pyrinomonadaceae bacterium]|nr:phosphoribosylglycinamide formyltransferase [Pyrinomonadaceae bacterium]